MPIAVILFLCHPQPAAIQRVQRVLDRLAGLAGGRGRDLVARLPCGFDGGFQLGIGGHGMYPVLAMVRAAIVRLRARCNRRAGWNSFCLRRAIARRRVFLYNKSLRSIAARHINPSNPAAFAPQSSTATRSPFSGRYAPHRSAAIAVAPAGSTAWRNSRQIRVRAAVI